MLLFYYKVGVHWYFRFAVETGDNIDLNYENRKL